MKTLLALFLAAATVACSTTQKNSAIRDIDAFTAKVVQTIPEVPSIGIAVVQDGTRHAAAFGYADRENHVPATAQTGYYIGSTTKGFTGVVAAILAEQGRIDLDAPISKYLPEVKFGDTIDTQNLTLRHLLSHTGTIENNPIVMRTAFTGEHTTDTLIQLLSTSKPREPKFRYDNLGYVVASLIFQRITGRPWQQLHDEMVFTPLGMKNTTGYMSKARNLAMPYEMRSTGNMELLTYRKNDQMMHAAGGTVTTPEDLTRWLEAHVSGKWQASAIAETHRKQSVVEKPRGAFKGGAYGFGWYTGSYDNETVLFHGGGFEGWRSLFSLMPGRKIGVGVLTNSGIANPVTQLITSYAFDRLRNKPDLEADYAAKLARLRADFDAEKAKVIAETQTRAQRPWTLGHDLASYAGRYESPAYGVMQLDYRDGRLYATLGRMNSVLEPFTEPESARVELIPATGDILRFVFSNGPQPDAVKYQDFVFTRR